MIKVLIIGGGFGGCCAAHLLSKKGWDITLIEKGSFLGGGCKTLTYGDHPYTFGPRHFLTRKEKLFSFLNSYVPMRRIQEHEFLTYVERDPGFYHFDSLFVEHPYHVYYPDSDSVVLCHNSPVFQR